MGSAIFLKRSSAPGPGRPQNENIISVAADGNAEPDRLHGARLADDFGQIFEFRCSLESQECGVAMPIQLPRLKGFVSVVRYFFI
jgi:hypothetical protein